MLVRVAQGGRIVHTSAERTGMEPSCLARALATLPLPDGLFVHPICFRRPRDAPRDRLDKRPRRRDGAAARSSDPVLEACLARLRARLRVAPEPERALEVEVKLRWRK
jgi:hypothetical protein